MSLVPSLPDLTMLLPPPPPPPPPPHMADSAAEQMPKRKRGKEPRKANYMKKILNNDKATKASSFLKRKPTLKKKAYELQTLCDVSICMVCYDSNGNLDTWPESRPDVVSVIHSYREAEEQEKRGSDVISFLELKKKKLAVKTEENMKRTCEEVASELAKLFDGLSEDALEDSLEGLDSKLKLMKERMEMLQLDQSTDRCESKEIVPKLENAKPDPEVGLPIAMVDNKASLEAADHLGSMLSPCDISNSVPKLENFNPMVGFWGNMNLLPRNNCFEHVGTSYRVMPEDYSVNNNLGRHALAGSTNGPFCEAKFSNDLSMLGFSDLPLGSYINANMYNLAAGNDGFLDHNNGYSFGYGQDGGFASLCLAAPTDAIHIPWPSWNASN